MAELAGFTIAEMIDDYYASRLDARTCERLASPDNELGIRAARNRAIMAIIDAEFVRRGEPRPWLGEDIPVITP